MYEEKPKKRPRKNPQLDRGFSYGDIAKIVALSGYSESTVRKVAVYGIRKNAKVMEAAQKVKEFNQSLKTA